MQDNINETFKREFLKLKYREDVNKANEQFIQEIVSNIARKDNQEIKR